MKWIISILLLLNSLFGYNQCLQMDVVILIDGSSSLSVEQQIIASEVLSEFIDRFEYSENGIKLSVLSFANYVAYLSELTSDKERLSLTPKKYIAYYEQNGLYTYTDVGLYHASKMLLEKGRPGVHQVIVLITDGLPEGKDNVVEDSLEAAEQIKSAGIIIFGILIEGNYESEEILQSMSSPGCYLGTTWELLIEEIKKLDICN